MSNYEDIKGITEHMLPPTEGIYEIVDRLIVAINDLPSKLVDLSDEEIGSLSDHTDTIHPTALLLVEMGLDIQLLDATVQSLKGASARIMGATISNPMDKVLAEMVMDECIANAGGIRQSYETVKKERDRQVEATNASES